VGQDVVGVDDVGSLALGDQRVRQVDAEELGDGWDALLLGDFGDVGAGSMPRTGTPARW